MPGSSTPVGVVSAFLWSDMVALPRFMNTSIGDLWIPALTLAGLVASFAFGLHKVIQQGNVITTLSISLIWILYRCE